MLTIIKLKCFWQFVKILFKQFIWIV